MRNRSLWKLILGENTPIYDEGTPEIVGKEGEYFYVTFHGVDATKGPLELMRGIARTKNFVHYEAVNHAPIYTKADCAHWGVAWQSPGCYGGGAAGTQKLGANYYMLIESSDLSGGCVPNQDWVFGLPRSPSFTGPWSPMPDAAVAYSTKEATAGGKRPACGLGYPQLFADEVGKQHPLMTRGGSSPGHLLYDLRRDAPAALYTFREGPGHTYTNSDVLSRGDPEAETAQVAWVADPTDGTFSLRFNGTNSVMTAPAGPEFDLRAYARLEVRAGFDSPPSAASALVAGKLGSYWLEYYASGTLCFWVTAAGKPHSACLNIGADVGVKHSYAGEYDGTKVRVLRDGNEAASAAAAGTLVSNSEPFRVGAAAPSASNFYASFRGTVDFIRLDDKP